MFKEFKEFIARGSVIDLAVGVIVGGAFGKIVSSLVEDVVMPPIGLLLRGVDFGNLFLTLKGARAETVKAAKEAGAVTINYGLFLNTLIQFLIVAFVVFLIVRAINRMKRKPEALPPTMKACGFCFSSIPIQATRCPFCTSELKAA